MRIFQSIIVSIMLLLTAKLSAQYDFIVAQDGSGNYTTVQDAVNAAPSNSSARTYIYIKNGTYYEVLSISSSKANITLIGENVINTVITYNNYASKINPATGLEYGTSGSASVFIDGAGFYAANITFSNTSGASAGQAVAVRSTADKAVFKNCRFLGYQDTYYARSGRAYHVDCYFKGNTDFIFGGAIGYFENCDIYTVGGAAITAGSHASNIAFGYVFNNCSITGSGTNITDLGRPWYPYASVTFMNTYMSGAISAVGWNDWGNASNQSTARFAEYNNSGAGYVPGSRPSWVTILTSSQASSYTMLNVLKATNADPQVTDNWNPNTTISQVESVTGGGSGGASAFSTIEAENYLDQYGVQTESCSEGGLDVGYIENGDWIRYNSLDFGSGASSLSLRVASNTDGGTISVRLDELDGTLIGTCNVSGTGGWQSWTDVTCNVSSVGGVHDLYLVFSGGSGYLFNINYFIFTASTGTGTYNGTYSFVAAHSGKAMDVYEWGTTEGTNIDQWEYFGSKCQQFIVAPVDGVWHSIKPVIATDLGLDIYEISTENGANVNLWSYWGGEGQQFKFEDMGNGYCHIIARNSGKCLDVESKSTDNGANIQQWDCSSTGLNQQWSLISVKSADENGFSLPESQNTDLKVHPNPVKKYLNVSVSNDYADPVQVAIYNTLGELVYELGGINNNSSIDVSNLVPGVYLLKAGAGQQSLSQMFLKK